jgi:hypothetical protein
MDSGCHIRPGGASAESPRSTPGPPHRRLQVVGRPSSVRAVDGRSPARGLSGVVGGGEGGSDVHDPAASGTWTATDAYVDMGSKSIGLPTSVWRIGSNLVDDLLPSPFQLFIRDQAISVEFPDLAESSFDVASSRIVCLSSISLPCPLAGREGRVRLRGYSEPCRKNADQREEEPQEEVESTAAPLRLGDRGRYDAADHRDDQPRDNDELDCDFDEVLP